MKTYEYDHDECAARLGSAIKILEKEFEQCEDGIFSHFDEVRELLVYVADALPGGDHGPNAMDAIVMLLDNDAADAIEDIIEKLNKFHLPAFVCPHCGHAIYD